MRADDGEKLIPGIVPVLAPNEASILFTAGVPLFEELLGDGFQHENWTSIGNIKGFIAQESQNTGAGESQTA